MPSFLEKAFPDNLHLQPKNLKELCEASILWFIFHLVEISYASQMNSFSSRNFIKQDLHHCFSSTNVIFQLRGRQNIFLNFKFTVIFNYTFNWRKKI
jgi:hypothetical protein